MPARGFTLIELLIVVIIIAILIGLVLALGPALQGSAKARQTQDILRTMDIALDQFYAETGGPPSLWIGAPDPDSTRQQIGATALLPMFDGVNTTESDTDPSRQSYINTGGLFVQQLADAGLDTLLDALPDDRIVFFDGDQQVGRRRSDGVRPLDLGQVGSTSDDGEQAPIRTVLDAWDRPIRFVHPALDGVWTDEALNNPDQLGNSRGVGLDVVLPPPDGLGLFPEVRPPLTTFSSALKLRRNVITESMAKDTGNVQFYDSPGDLNTRFLGDSDGGQAVNDRPYFYSTGFDGDPSTRINGRNVYSNEPNFLVIN
ncbi:MAG: prepilin-type N-terminal cleavage/methylation domain-containing protein [Planctomycetota bacterium]